MIAQTGCCFEVGELELSWTVLSLAGSSMPPGSATENFPSLCFESSRVFSFSILAVSFWRMCSLDCNAEHFAVQKGSDYN